MGWGWVFTIFIFSFGIWGGRAGGIYLGRRYGLSNPASIVRLVVSPTGKKEGVLELELGGGGLKEVESGMGAAPGLRNSEIDKAGRLWVAGQGTKMSGSIGLDSVEFFSITFLN